MSLLLACAVLLLDLGAGPNAAAAVYKCTDAKGSTSYSDVPCDPNAERIETQAAANPQIPSSGSASGVSAARILNAVYASPRNGQRLDVTDRVRSLCAHASTSGCVVGCNNGLAGDPDFGQVKFCKISYQCGGGRVRDVQIEEGQLATLVCRSDVQIATAVPSPAPGTTSALQLTPPTSPSSSSTGQLAEDSRKPATAVALTIGPGDPSPGVSRTRPAVVGCAGTGTPGGGLFLAGLTVKPPPSGLMANTPPTTPFLRLVSSGGDQIWQATVPAKASIDCAHAEQNGHFWVTGTQFLPEDPVGTKHQREYVMRIGRDGSFSAPLPIDKMDRLHFPNCGIETESGFVLAGTGAHDKYLVPWIGMIDRSGHLAWEHAFSQDQDQLFTVSGGERCAGLRQMADGRLVWAAEIGIAHSAEEIGTPFGSHWGVLTVVLDRQGAVLHRARDTDVRSPLLAVSHDRIIVYSTLAPALPPRPKTQADAIRQLMTMTPPKLGLQRVIYSLELGELNRGLVSDDGNLIPQHSTANGGVLALGWDESTKKTTLQYIAPDAQMSSPLTLDVLPAPGAPGRADLVFSDAAPGKAQMFVLSEQDGGRVYALGYKDNAINLGTLTAQTPQSPNSRPTVKPALPSSSEVTPGLPIDNVRLKQLDELITFLGVLSQQESTSEFTLALSMQMVAPEDPSWNPSHPRWTAVHDLVSKDLARDLGPANAAAERAMVPLWERHLSRELAAPELQYLLDFYRSPRGIRYREFQLALDRARQSAVTEYLTERGHVSSKATPELQAVGERANALSLAVILGRNEATPPAGARSTASKAQDPSLSARFASEFRQLEVQYKDELDAFRIFNQSPAIVSVHKAALGVTNELPDVPEYQRQFALSLSEPLKRSAEWRAAYAGQAVPSKDSGHP